MKIETMTIRGAGAAGRAYYGAISELWGASVRPRTYVGTSAGAIAACAMALHGVPSALGDAVCDPALARISQDLYGPAAWLERPVDAWRLWNRGGANSGEPLAVWLRKLLGDLTFAQLHRDTGRQAVVWAYDMDRRAPARLDRHTAPHVELWRACLASAAIPGYFLSVVIGGRRYLDGGLVVNDPLPPLAATGEYEPGQVVGLRVNSRPRPEADQLSPQPDLWATIEAVAKGAVAAAEQAGRLALSREWQERYVEIDRLAVGSLEFDLSAARSRALVQSGRDAARAWLARQKG